MKESYVLKRRNGEACGYVMARDKEVRVRLPNEKGTAKMAVIYADQTQTLEGMLDGLERTYPAAGSRLLGAYVCSGGRLLMDTGEAARRAFERAEEACQSAQRPEGKRKDGARRGCADARAPPNRRRYNRGGGAQMAAAALHAGSEVCKRRMEGQSRGGALKTVRFAALLCRRPISRM